MGYLTLFFGTFSNILNKHNKFFKFLQSVFRLFSQSLRRKIQI